MYFTLWTCFLIFMESLFLHFAQSNEFFQVTRYTQSPEDQNLDSREEPVTKKRFWKIDEFLHQRFGVETRQNQNSVIDFQKKPTLRHENSMHSKRKLKKKQKLNSFDTNHPEFDKENETEEFPKDSASISFNSEIKMDNLGSPEKVKESFEKRFGLNSHRKKFEKEKFLEHYGRVKDRMQCKDPTPKIINVNDINPDPLKTYYPPCTIIHQCTNDSGCCMDKKKCSPHRTQNITLYFKVKIKEDNEKFSTTYEELNFINHTECQCSINENGSVGDLSETSVKVQEFDSTIPFENKNCICSTPFSKRLMADGSCVCDCYDNQYDCLRLKKGLADFDSNATLCISAKKCTLPTCSYGDYSVKSGKCPKQH